MRGTPLRRRSTSRPKFVRFAIILIGTVSCVSLLTVYSFISHGKASPAPPLSAPSSVGSQRALAPTFPQESVAGPRVCLLGNAKTVAEARAVQSHWDGARGFWSVWGQEQAELTTAAQANTDGSRRDVFTNLDVSSPGLFEFIYCPRTGGCTWKDGVHKAMLRSREMGVSCDYYFVISGSATWHRSPLFPPVTLPAGDGSVLSAGTKETTPLQKSTVSPAATRPSLKPNLKQTLQRDHISSDDDTSTPSLFEELQHELRHWKPAILGFDPVSPDPSTGAGAALCRKAYAADRVRPLTVIDTNVNVVIHSSIIDLILPFPPSGEGGFSGNWTLPSIWLSVVALPIFRANAIQLNSIRFASQATPPLDLGRDMIYTDKDLLNLGHPTEHHLVEAYTDFLKTGLKIWVAGGDIRPSDIDWEPQVGSPPYHLSLSSRLDTVYSVSHSAIDHQIRNLVAHQAGQFRIMVLARFEVSLLIACLESLKHALYGSAHVVSLQIQLLYPKDKDKKAARKHLDSFEWSHGPLHIREDASLSLSSPFWYPSSRFEFGVLLDDSVRVSEYYFSYLVDCTNRFPEAESARVLGCALTAASINYAGERTSRVQSGGKPVYVQDALSPALMLLPWKWREFLTWASERPMDASLALPGMHSNVWPSSGDLRRMLARFITEKGYVVAYPNMEHAALAVARVAYSPALQHLPELPLLTRAVAFNSPSLAASQIQLPPISMLYDWMRNSIGSVLAPTDLKGFDYLTVVMPGYSRPNILAETVAYYCDLTILEEIVVVWNNLEVDPPPLEHVKCSVRVLRQSENSLHNRFIPIAGLKTWAVMSIDDDVRLDLTHVEQAFKTWQMYPEHMIGFLNTARGAQPGATPNEWQYRNHHPEDIRLYRPVECPSPERANDMNFVLTGGAIFHAKFLYAYTHGMEQGVVRGRAIVSEMFNGEDILFAFMHARLTKLPPIIVDAKWDMKLMSSAPGLQKRVGHYASRAFIIAEMVQVFGEMPLLPAMGFLWRGHPHIITCDDEIPPPKKKKKL